MRYERTPGLRAKVIACVEKVIDEGFKLTPNVYFDGESCCAIGAIAICQQGAESLGRERGDTHVALSLLHLGCQPIELDSLEAGFESWGLRHLYEFDDEAYAIGAYIRDNYVEVDVEEYL